MADTNKPQVQRINAELINYRLDAMQKGIDELLAQAGNYVSVKDYAELYTEFREFKAEVQKNYVKKADTKTLRNIGVAVITSVAITVVTLIVTFITGGGLNNGSK